MREFQRKKKIRRYLYSRLSLIILLILLILTIKGTWGVYQKEYESRANLKRIEQELASLMARQAMLSRNSDRLSTPEGVEAEIRERFQVAKPGERMVVLVEEGEAEDEKETSDHSLVSRFFDFFR